MQLEIKVLNNPKSYCIIRKNQYINNKNDYYIALAAGLSYDEYIDLLKSLGGTYYNFHETIIFRTLEQVEKAIEIVESKIIMGKLTNLK